MIRFFLGRVLPSLLLIFVSTPERASAQPAGFGFGVGPGWSGPGPYASGFQRWGRYPAAPSAWGYQGLAGGPFLTPWYPYAGWPGFTGAFGSFWTNGLSLYGPPVPVYGPLPGVLGNSDFVRQWHARPTLGTGFGYFGWVGPYAASPRPRNLSVNVWPMMERVGGMGEGAIVANDPAAAPSQVLYLSVKVSQPAAEVFVEGVKTAMSGTDRLFESPPLEPGKVYAYDITARWIEGGATVERKKTVKGKPGEVIRVDLTQ